jgi:hypothetical protein
MESGVSDFCDLPPHYSNAWFLIIVIVVALLLIMTFTLIGSLGIVERNSNMPPTVSIWKKKDIVEGSIGRVGLSDALKCATDLMQNDVTGVVSICTIARNDGCNLIDDRWIIPPLILLDVDMNA